MEQLRTFLVEFYRGSKERYVHARYALVAFDLVIIVYFVVTTFLPPYSWIAMVDLLIGAVLLIELLARTVIERDRIYFLL
ncbi:MAG: ion transporter, partial [Burkholderiales bacterium]|nr:ion transporter [Burkholderiales bacterium]